jgi:hypothetical protein
LAGLRFVPKLEQVDDSRKELVAEQNEMLTSCSI